MQHSSQRQAVLLRREQSPVGPPTGASLGPLGFCCGRDSQGRAPQCEAPCARAAALMSLSEVRHVYCVPYSKGERATTAAAAGGTLRAARIDAALSKALGRAEHLDRQQKECVALLRLLLLLLLLGLLVLVLFLVPLPVR